MIYHLPFDNDDKFGYRFASNNAIAFMQGVPDIRILDTPLQVEIIE